MKTINLAEEQWVNAVLRYADPLNMGDLVEFVRERFESGLSESTPEAEHDAWVDAIVADYYG